MRRTGAMRNFARGGNGFVAGSFFYCDLRTDDVATETDTHLEALVLPMVPCDYYARRLRTRTPVIHGEARVSIIRTGYHRLRGIPSGDLEHAAYQKSCNLWAEHHPSIRILWERSIHSCILLQLLWGKHMRKG